MKKKKFKGNFTNPYGIGAGKMVLLHTSWLG